MTLSADYSDGEDPEENVDSVCIDNGGFEDVDSGDDGVGDDNGDDDDEASEDPGPPQRIWILVCHPAAE